MQACKDWKVNSKNNWNVPKSTKDWNFTLLAFGSGTNDLTMDMLYLRYKWLQWKFKGQSICKDCGFELISEDDTLKYDKDSSSPAIGILYTINKSLSLNTWYYYESKIELQNLI